MCGGFFDGMNIALYILIESIRYDECQANATNSNTW
jgi:hypothetical protein